MCFPRNFKKNIDFSAYNFQAILPPPPAPEAEEAEEIQIGSCGTPTIERSITAVLVVVATRHSTAVLFARL